MTDNELNRAIQHVTANTSYERDAVAGIVRTGFAELADLAGSGAEAFERVTLLGYVCFWTMRKTGQLETMVREVLGYGARWLDDLYETLLRHQPGLLEEPGAETR